MREFKITKPEIKDNLWLNKDFIDFVFNNSNEAILILNGSDWKIIECNQKSIELFHADAKSLLIDYYFFSLCQSEPAEFSKAMIMNEINTGKTYRQELSFRTFNNHSFWGHLSARRLSMGDHSIIVFKISKVIDYLKAEGSISVLFKKTSKVTGNLFFRELTSLLTQTFDTRYAFIGIIDKDPGYLNIIQFWANGKEGENFVLELNNNPANNVLKGYISYYPQKLDELFPHDQLISNMAIESFMGSPIYNNNNKPIGVLGLMDDKPMKEIPNTRYILTVFSTRVGAELERIESEKKLRLHIHSLENTGFNQV